MQAEQLKLLVIDALEDIKAEDIQVLDVTGMTDVTDMMIIATGKSTRQVKALANEVVMQAKAAGIQPLGVEGENIGEWALVDLGDVIAHIMTPPLQVVAGAVGGLDQGLEHAPDLGQCRRVLGLAAGGPGGAVVGRGDRQQLLGQQRVAVAIGIQRRIAHRIGRQQPAGQLQGLDKGRRGSRRVGAEGILGRQRLGRLGRARGEAGQDDQGRGAAPRSQRLDQQGLVLPT